MNRISKQFPFPYFDYGNAKIFLLFGVVLLFAAPLFGQAKVDDSKDSDAPTVTYRLQKGDKISVKFLYQTELNEASVVVRPDGFINLQLIDDVKAEGLTIAELKKKLEKEYDETLLNPVISISLLEFVAPRVFIGGQVNKPGRYDLRDARTLVEVIFLAGGFTKDANRKNVLRARRNEKGEWDIIAVNVMDVLKQKKGEQDLPLDDGDRIFVFESKISQINKAIETFRGLLPKFL